MNDFNTITRTRPKKRTRARRGDGFFEALGDIGKSIGNSIKTDVVGGVAKSIHDQLINPTTTQTVPQEQPDDFDFASWINAKEDELEQAHTEGGEQEHTIQRSRLPEQVVFSHVDEKLRQEIEEVRHELKALMETMKNVEQQIEKAIIEEVVNPGVYHFNYFQKVKLWLRFMRKSLSSGSLWHEMSNSRSQRGAYWKGVKKSGTKFMLSQERTVATSV